MTHPDFDSYRNEQRITPQDTRLRLNLFVGESFTNFMVLNAVSKALGYKHDPTLSSDWYAKKAETMLASAPVQDLLAEVALVDLSDTRQRGVYESGYAIELAFVGTPDDLERLVEIGRRVVQETFKKTNRHASYLRMDPAYPNRVDVTFR